MSDITTDLITDKAQWEIFILSHPEANFLHSWNWGKFHKNLGKKIFRIGIFEDKKLVGAVQCVKETAKRGTYFTIAGGPITDWSREDYLKSIFNEVKKLAKEERCSFIRMRPQVLDTEETVKLISGMGWTPSPMHLTADLTLQLDLSKTEEDLLKEMRKNTRYEVRRSHKEEIQVKESKDLEDIKLFYDQQLKVAKKHGFVPFAYEFLYEQFKAFVIDNQVSLFHAYKDDTLLASAFIIFYNGEAVYHYGVSTSENNHLPGAYACQWKAIQMAKLRGCKRYNFWGIAPKDNPNHRFSGVSLFKRGFGGEEVQYLPAHDLPVSWIYIGVKGFEWLRRKMRKL